MERGEDVAPQLRAMQALGANTIRVFLMAHYIPLNAGLSPYICDRSVIRPFASLAASVGLAVEWVIGADLQMFGWDRNTFRRRIATVLDERLRDRPSFWELVNEPQKNLAPGMSLYEFIDDLAQRPDLFWATGDYDILDRASWIGGRYGTYHGKREDPIVEAGKEPFYYVKGFDDRGKPDGRFFCGWNRPWDANEPIGFADVAMPGRRANSVDYADDLGAALATGAAGLCFHSDRGIAGQVPTEIEAACGRALFAAADRIPADAPNWRYSHDGAAGYPFIGNDPRIAECVSRRAPNGDIWCVATGARGYQPVCLPGYQIARALNPRGTQWLVRGREERRRIWIGNSGESAF